MKILKTYSKDAFDIEDHEAEEVLRVIAEGKQKGIFIQGNYIAVSNISEVIKADDHEIPDGGYLPESREDYLLAGTVEQQAAMNEKCSSGLLKGLLKYCDGNPNAMKARALYDQKLQDHVRRFSLIGTNN